MKASSAYGYTILEVMLFIVISASMFVLAMTSFSGRQQDIQFTQAVREFDAKLQDTINDVSTGFFVTSPDLVCSANELLSSRPVIDDNPSATNPSELGTNSECVFIGKALHFAPNETGTDEDDSLMSIYNLVGRRLTPLPDQKNTTTLAEAKPVAMAPNGTEFTDISENYQLKYGLRISRVAVNDGSSSGAGSDTGAIGLFGGFSRVAAGSGSTAEISETQAIRYASIPATTIGLGQGQVVGEINRVTDENPAPSGDVTVDTSSDTGIIICLSDDSGRRRASVTIGGTGRASTRVDFDTYNRTVCG